MVRHNQAIRWLLLTNCLRVFDHFVGLALKGLNLISTYARLLPFLHDRAVEITAAVCID